MAEIKHITLPDGSTHDLRDAVLTGVVAVKGTQTASTNAWTGAIDIPALYDGLTIAYYLPYAGTSTAATLNLTLAGGGTTGAKDVYYAANTRATTHYGAGSTILLTYWSAGSISVAGTATTNDRWTSFDYNTNTTMTYGHYSYYFRPYAGSALYRYKLCLQGADHRLYPIVVTNQTSAAQVAKVPQSAPLRPYNIWYYMTTTAISAGAVIGANTLEEAGYDTTASYNFNTQAPAYQMIYLRGTYDKSTDLFTLYNDGSSPCTSYYAYVPTNTANINLADYFVAGYYYLLVGGTYSTANYFNLLAHNPFYYFDGTNLIPASTKIAADSDSAITTAEIDAIVI